MSSSSNVKTTKLNSSSNSILDNTQNITNNNYDDSLEFDFALCHRYCSYCGYI